MAKGEDDFIRVFNMPPSMRPYANLVVNDQEMDVVLGMDNRSLTEALYHDGTTVSVHGEKFRAMVFDAENCYGCGLCANTCPENAISMQPL